MSMSSAPERPARDSVSLEEEQDWTIRVLSSPSLSLLLSMLVDQNTSYGRTFPAAKRPTKGETLDPSSVRWTRSGMLSDGEYSILSTPDHAASPTLSLNDASVCSLSDLLTQDVQPEFYLTPRACAGIHHRFERVGKLEKLPVRFREILEAMTTEHVLS